MESQRPSPAVVSRPITQIGSINSAQAIHRPTLTSINTPPPAGIASAQPMRMIPTSATGPAKVNMPGSLPGAATTTMTPTSVTASTGNGTSLSSATTHIQSQGGIPARPLLVNGQMMATQQLPMQRPPVPTQTFARSMPMMTSQIKQEYRPTGQPLGFDPMCMDFQSKDLNDEAENERTRLENRERKKRWREANEDRNKDNDLRCRVNKRAHKLYGKEPSKAKDMWIEEEFNKRKSKRQEKEGKGPDGNLLIEGTDLSSLNHYEMNSVIMSTLTDFAANPAAPALKDNADLNAMLEKLRADPDTIKAMLLGQPRIGAPLTSDNVFKMNADGSGSRNAFSDEEDDDRESNLGSVLNGSIDLNAMANDLLGLNADLLPMAGLAKDTATESLQQQTAVGKTDDTASYRRFSTHSNGNDGSSQHQTYGIGNGFEPQVALALSSELFRLVSMQPVERNKTIDLTQEPTPVQPAAVVVQPAAVVVQPTAAVVQPAAVIQPAASSSVAEASRTGMVGACNTPGLPIEQRIEA